MSDLEELDLELDDMTECMTSNVDDYIMGDCRRPALSETWMEVPQKDRSSHLQYREFVTFSFLILHRRFFFVSVTTCYLGYCCRGLSSADTHYVEFPLPHSRSQLWGDSDCDGVCAYCSH